MLHEEPPLTAASAGREDEAPASRAPHLFRYNWETTMADHGEHDVNRRDLVVGACATVAAAPIAAKAQTATAGRPETQAAGAAAAPVAVRLALTVNGRPQELEVDTRTTLLDLLRENLRLTGTKKGCDHGQCGACTVMVDGRRVLSCLTLAVMHQADSVTTIEGLGQPEKLHPMQAAFIKHDGYQCGYCTPGQICSSVAMLDEIKAGIPSHATADLLAPAEMTEAEIRERMSGNLCRCGAYSNIVEAITEVGRQA